MQNATCNFTTTPTVVFSKPNQHVAICSHQLVHVVMETGGLNLCLSSDSLTH